MRTIDLVEIGPWILVPAAVWIVILPAAVYIDYIVRGVHSAQPMRKHRRSWLMEAHRLLGMTGEQLMERAQASHAAPAVKAASTANGASAVHESFLEGEARTFESMRVCGSIGFAGWSLLFVSSELPVVKQLSGLTMGFLFVGSAWLLAAPLLWRRKGRYSTTLGRDSALRIGFSFIVISLSSMVIDLRIPVAMVIGVIVVYLIVLREASQTVATINIHRMCFTTSR
jgi:hypothetical protein